MATVSIIKSRCSSDIQVFCPCNPSEEQRIVLFWVSFKKMKQVIDGHLVIVYRTRSFFFPHTTGLRMLCGVTNCFTFKTVYGKVDITSYKYSYSNIINWMIHSNALTFSIILYHIEGLKSQLHPFKLDVTLMWITCKQTCQTFSTSANYASYQTEPCIWMEECPLEISVKMVIFYRIIKSIKSQWWSKSNV